MAAEREGMRPWPASARKSAVPSFVRHGHWPQSHSSQAQSQSLPHFFSLSPRTFAQQQPECTPAFVLPLRAGAPEAHTTSASLMPGYVVVEGSGALCWVTADGVAVQRRHLTQEFGGFRDVPPGDHTLAIATTWTGPPLTARFSLKPGGVAVLKIEEERLVEEKDSEAHAAMARAVVVGTMKSNLVPFPSSADDPDSDRSGRTSPTLQQQEAPVKLDDLFADLRADPTSATLQGLYLDMVHYQLLRGNMQAEVHMFTAMPGYVVVEGSGALCWVTADGVAVQRSYLTQEFGGFRDVPPGDHTLAIATTWTGPPLTASFSLKPGGVAVLKIEEERLVEEEDSEAHAAMARAVVVGTMKSNLVPFPSPADDPLSDDRSDDSMRVPQQEQQEAPVVALRTKLDDLFADLRADPTSATLQGLYLDMVHYQLLRGNMQAEVHMFTEFGKTIRPPTTSSMTQSLPSFLSHAPLFSLPGITSSTSTHTHKARICPSVLSSSSKGVPPSPNTPAARCRSNSVGAVPAKQSRLGRAPDALLSLSPRATALTLSLSPRTVGTASASLMPGYVVVEGSGALCWVTADGVAVQRRHLTQEFGGFRDVPPGDHTLAIATTWTGTPLIARFSLKPGGVAVLKIEEERLVEEEDSEAHAAMARAVVVGTMKSNLVPFPSPADDPLSDDRSDDSMRVPQQEQQEAPVVTLRTKLDDLFADLRADPTSATLRGLYLDMVHYQLLRGNMQAEVHLYTEYAKVMSLPSFLCLSPRFSLSGDASTGSAPLSQQSSRARPSEGSRPPTVSSVSSSSPKALALASSDAPLVLQRFPTAARSCPSILGAAGKPSTASSSASAASPRPPTTRPRSNSVGGPIRPLRYPASPETLSPSPRATALTLQPSSPRTQPQQQIPSPKLLASSKAALGSPAATPGRAWASATAPTPASVSCLRGFVVVEGSGALCWVTADGVAVQRSYLTQEFGGFRDVPPGDHTLAIATTWTGPPLTARFSLKPGGVAVLKIEEERLVEEEDSEAHAAMARAVVVGTMKSNLVPFPSPADDPDSDRSGRTSPALQQQEAPALAPSSPQGQHRHKHGHSGRCPEGCAHRVTVWDISKLDDLFADLRADPTSATLQGLYLDMVHYQLLRGSMQAEVHMFTEFARAIVRHLEALPELRAVLCGDDTVGNFREALKSHRRESVSVLGNRMQDLLEEDVQQQQQRLQQQSSF
eukprot:m51a1_g5030 hypothetical protein (1208) ;mRNA; f:356752-365938